MLICDQYRINEHKTHTKVSYQTTFCLDHKIAEFDEEGSLAFEMYKTCNEGLQTHKQDLESFRNGELSRKFPI